MKAIKNIILGGMVLISLSSCNDLLDIDPVNSMIPKSVEDYEAVLLGAYPDNEFFMKTEMMTDNVAVNPDGYGDMQRDYVPWYTWADSHQTDGQEYDYYWGELYRSIFYANTIIDDFEEKEVLPEDQELFETIKGEAHAIRALSYFYLANLYAEPYSSENLAKACVPFSITTEDLHERTQNNTRESVEVVWNLIVADLEEASKLLAGKRPNTKVRFNYHSVEALRARVYLYMDNLDAAISSSSKVITTFKPWDMNNIQDIIESENEPLEYLFTGERGVMDTGYQEDVLFSMCTNGGRKGAGGNIYYYSRGLKKPSDDLFNCFIEKGIENDTIYDYRRFIFESFADTETYYGKQTGKTVYNMYSYQGPQHPYIGIKLGEVILIRAEAYARKQLNAKAIDDVKLLMKKRIQTDHFPDYEAMVDAETDVLARVLKERRKETAFDGGLRWFDLRRLGKPALTHVDKEGNVFELKKGDLRYVLQIPISEQMHSPNMVLNPR
ncbi:RagB/SusD family nutrient uptake outer membrane protein [Marinifilum fragile]